jgi:hypothetical protein
MGKPHGSTSHKTITKALEDPLLGPHNPQNRLYPQSQLCLGAPSLTIVSKPKSGPKLTNVSPKLGRGPTSHHICSKKSYINGSSGGLYGIYQLYKGWCVNVPFFNGWISLCLCTKSWNNHLCYWVCF